MASLAAWTAARVILEAIPGITFAWPNEQYDLPGDGSPFVRVGGRGGDSRPGEVGANGMWTERGAIECHILCPVGTGTTAARTTADTIVAAFRALPGTPDIIWEGWQLDEGENSEDGAFFVLHLSLDYRTQSILTP